MLTACQKVMELFVREKVIPVLIFSIIACILIGSRTFYNANLDEGMIWSSAMKVSEGQVMYRDFFEFWTPGTVYLLAGLFKIFGPYLWVSRVVYILSSLVLYGFYFAFLGKIGFSQKLRVAAVVLFAAIGTVYMAISHHWFGLIGVLGSLYFLSAFYTSTEKYPTNKLVMAGIAAGITALFMQYEGVVAISGGIATILMLTPRESRWRKLKIFLIPILVIGTVVCGYFAFQQALSQLSYSTVVFPLLQYKGSNTGLPSAIWLYQSVLLFLSITYLVRTTILTSGLKILIIFAVLMQIAGLTTTSFMHAFLLGFLSNAVLLYSLGKIVQRIKPVEIKQNLKQFSELMATIDTRKFAFSLLFGLFVLIYAVRIVQGITELWSDVLIPRQLVTLPAGRVAASPTLAQRLESVSSFVSQQTEPHQPVYFGPYSSYYNFLLQRPNPLPYSQLTPGYNPEFMFAHAIKILETTKPQYIVLLPRESVFPFGQNNSLYHYVNQNYSTALILKPLDETGRRPLDQESLDAIWQRK